DVIHEDCALVADPIDVRGFADHQAAVIDARLHPADVITHDEENVGLLLLLRGWLGGGQRYAGGAGQQTEPTLSWDFHNLVPPIVRLSDGSASPPNDTSEPQMTCRRVHVFGMTRRRAVAAAVIRRTKM